MNLDAKQAATDKVCEQFWNDEISEAAARNLIAQIWGTDKFFERFLLDYATGQ